MLINKLLVGGIGICACLAAVWNGSSAGFMAACCFIELLALASAVDVATRTVSHGTIAAMVAVRVLAVGADALMAGDAASALLGAVFTTCFQGMAIAFPLFVLALAMERAMKRSALGGGDIKLMFAAGCFLGAPAAACALGMACVLGLAMAALTRQSTFPFVPPIALGCIVMLFVG